MSSRTLVSFTAAGGKPGPLRAALLEEARKHLDKPKIRYMVAADKNMPAYLDWKNVEIWASSQVEAVMALLDFLNDNLRSVPVGSEPDEHHDNYAVVRRESDPRTLEEILRIRVEFAPEDFITCGHQNCDNWLTEWPEETRRITVPELLSSSEGTEGDGAAAQAGAARD